MFIRMRESKGFTLVELMIVVAIIGILAAVAVPFYQKYITKSRLTSKVFPGMHAIETNLGSFYSFQQRLPAVGSLTLPEMFADADTRCFTPNIIAGSKLEIQIADSDVCLELKALRNQKLTAKASFANGKIVGWELGGSVAIQLGLEGEK